MMVCLKRCDAQTLCQLKAVSAGWQQRARRALFGRRSDVEVDVEELQHIGRLAAARQMPNLARLRGYGFTVELQAVGQADLEGEVKDDAPLGGVTLRSCIQGEGEPPHELLLAAVACAARGTVRGVPVQRLREDDAIGSLNLERSGLGVISAELLGLMLPAATSVHTLRCVTGTTPVAQRAQPAFPLPQRCARSLATTPRCSLVCQRPLTRTLSPFPSCPSLAVSNATASEPREPLRSLPFSTRRRSPTSSALPPPKCLLSCQRPLTHRLPSCPSLAVSEATKSEPRAPLRWLPSSTRRRSPTSSAPPPPKCLLSCQRPLTRLLSHCTHLAHPSQSFQQRHRSARGGQARGGAESDANHQPEVRCDLEPALSVRFCVSAH